MTAIDKAQMPFRSEATFVGSVLHVSRLVTTLLLVVIGAGALMRLYHISDPLVGIRQNDLAAVARNFAEGALNIWYPQVDWGGTSGGYVESEFQIYTYVIALLYRLFGVHEWIGRALNVGIYALSALVLFRLSRRLFNERVAVLATLFYSIAPLSYIYTRTFQPDALMSLGALVGVYYFWVWSEEGSWSGLLLSALAVSVAVLIKPTSLYLGLPLLYLAFRKYGEKVTHKLILWLYAAFILTSAYVWYTHALNLWRAYGNTFGIFDGWVKIGLPNDPTWLPFAQELFTRLVMQITTPVGLPLLLAGLFGKPLKRNLVLNWWAVGFAVSALLTAPGQYVYNYYQLPIVFVVATWMACGVDMLWQQRVLPPTLVRAVVVAACLLVVEFSFWQVSFGDLHDSTQVSNEEWGRIRFAERVARLTEPEALVVFARTYRGNPQLYQHRTAQGEWLECDPVDFYRSHRKGWSVDELQATPALVEQLHQRGAKYFATAFPEIFERRPELKTALDHTYTAVEITPQWAIYKLDNSQVMAQARP